MKPAAPRTPSKSNSQNEGKSFVEAIILNEVKKSFKFVDQTLGGLISKREGLDFISPRLEVVTDTRKVAEMGVSHNYNHRDKTIYFDLPGLVADMIAGQHFFNTNKKELTNEEFELAVRAITFMIVAHEYLHHVQFTTQIIERIINHFTSGNKYTDEQVSLIKKSVIEDMAELVAFTMMGAAHPRTVYGNTFIFLDKYNENHDYKPHLQNEEDFFDPRNGMRRSGYGHVKEKLSLARRMMLDLGRQKNRTNEINSVLDWAIFKSWKYSDNRYLELFTGSGPREDPRVKFSKIRRAMDIYAPVE